MAKIKTVYLANDNTEFFSEAEADAHNAFLDNEFQVEAYILHNEIEGAQATIVRKHLAGYASFLANPDLADMTEQARVIVQAQRAQAAAEADKRKADGLAKAAATRAAKKAAV